MITISSDSTQELANFKHWIEFASRTTERFYTKFKREFPDKKIKFKPIDQFDIQYKLTNGNKLFVDKYNFTIMGEIGKDGNIIPVKEFELAYTGKNIKDIEGE